ncbi:DNA replication/repair protein RecF [Clostridium niameyense]|uniref:DNA replication and repair protein RecF n=1 Tax=Clostridium niameyense TaxID=1622073 RepID=A0A6M0RC25_9CLOT|nr:DNA replication/repair protein RecF [Clostridium niameyense]NEZ47851.1 DNA replication/repair protein RecF [Clostridium niameyense]
MHIKNLCLRNFRSYKNIYLELNPNTNVFIGENAQGKTNILESIYYCSVGKSHRTNKDKELINWDSNESYVKLGVARKRLDKNIEIKVLKNGKKLITVNSIKLKKISELMGNLNVVMFSPDDLRIIKESPSNRRKFLDIELCKINNIYYHSLVQYNKILNERNYLLKRIDNKNILMLDVYDKQLSKYGAFIVKTRKKYLDKLNFIGKNIHKGITNESEVINFKYLCNVEDINLAEDELLSKLAKNRKKDIERFTTNIGPHRDDFFVTINDIDTRTFGSQGQQRTSVLTLKFASLEIIKETIGEYPVLLLDDVLSELDSNRQKYVLKSIKNIQTIITCTGMEEIEKYINKDSQVYLVTKGNIKRV